MSQLILLKLRNWTKYDL